MTDDRAARLAAIRERVETQGLPYGEEHVDRAWLLAEVDRLEAEHVRQVLLAGVDKARLSAAEEREARLRVGLSMLVGRVFDHITGESLSACWKLRDAAHMTRALLDAPAEAKP